MFEENIKTYIVSPELSSTPMAQYNRFELVDGKGCGINNFLCSYMKERHKDKKGGSGRSQRLPEKSNKSFHNVRFTIFGSPIHEAQDRGIEKTMQGVGREGS